MTGNDNLRRRVEVDCLDNCALRSFIARLSNLVIRQAENRSHRTNTHWNRVLHRLRAKANQPHRVIEL
jgi:hypothetical protein